MGQQNVLKREMTEYPKTRNALLYETKGIFLHRGQISCNTTCWRHFTTSSSFQCHKNYAISVATCPF